MEIKSRQIRASEGFHPFTSKPRIIVFPALRKGAMTQKYLVFFASLRLGAFALCFGGFRIGPKKLWLGVRDAFRNWVMLAV